MSYIRKIIIINDKQPFQNTYTFNISSPLYEKKTYQNIL